MTALRFFPRNSRFFLDERLSGDDANQWNSSPELWVSLGELFQESVMRGVCLPLFRVLLVGRIAGLVGIGAMLLGAGPLPAADSTANANPEKPKSAKAEATKSPVAK